MLSVEKQMLYLLSRTENMETQEMIQIYKERKYSAQYIRNTLTHLKKEGYVISPSHSTYQITDLGRLFVQSINRKPKRYGEEWNKSWYIVMLEVPEKERKKRYQFRSEILQLGFGHLYSSVYISPWNYWEEVIQCVRKLDLEENVTLFQGETQHGDITPQKVRRIWDLEKVITIYKNKWNWFSKEFQPFMYQTLETSKNPLDLFLLYLQLGEAVSELYMIDPMLPKELLPSSWEPKSILKELINNTSLISQAIPDNSPYAQFTKEQDLGLLL